MTGREELENYIIRRAHRPPGVTIAEVMKRQQGSMQAAYRFLAEMEACGCLIRSGGERGKPLLWRLKGLGGG